MREFGPTQAPPTSGREKMIMALEALQRQFDHLESDQTAMSSMKISNKGSFLALLSTHPPLEERIKALKNKSLF
jgi:heat shock protein HtpX